MRAVFPSPHRSPAENSSDSLLPPIRLPFTVVSEGGAGSGSGTPQSERSWGTRLGLWWADAEDEAAPGVVITGLQPGGPAAAGGALGMGDVIVEVEGKPVGTLGDLTRHLDAFGSGPVQLGVRSAAGGEPRRVSLR